MDKERVLAVLDILHPDQVVFHGRVDASRPIRRITVTAAQMRFGITHLDVDPANAWRLLRNAGFVPL